MELNQNEKMLIGRPQDAPLKDKYDIMIDIEKLCCTKQDPCADLEYIIQNAYRLWDMHNRIRDTEMKKIVLMVKQ